MRNQSHSSPRFAYLLATELALIALYSFVVGDRPPSGIFGVLASPALLAGVYAVVGERRIAAVGFVLGSAAMLSNVAMLLTTKPRASTASLVCWILFHMFVVVVVLRSVLMSPAVTMDTLYGAIAVYLAFGIACGIGYALLERIHQAHSIRCWDTTSASDGPTIRFSVS